MHFSSLITEALENNLKIAINTDQSVKIVLADFQYFQHQSILQRLCTTFA
jgi:hypothetical protein